MLVLDGHAEKEYVLQEMMSDDIVGTATST